MTRDNGAGRSQSRTSAQASSPTSPGAASPAAAAPPQSPQTPGAARRRQRPGATTKGAAPAPEALAGLRGGKVTLRALTKSDLEALRGFVNDPEVMVFSNTYRPVSDVEQAAWFEKTVARGDVWFGIADGAGDGTLIGTCCLVDFDWIARMAELRIRIGDKRAWGGGRGTDACAVLVRYAFTELNLERIWLRVFATNPRAQRMYEGLGFTSEGKLRRAAVVEGRAVDVVVMGLLRDEWQRSKR